MNIFQPKSMLVTGGAGFIGANFVRYVLTHETEIKIINLDLLTYAGSKKNLADLPNAHRHQFIHGDIADQSLIEKILRDYNIDTIVHFAAESHVDRSIASPIDFVRTNVVGTFVLLEAARKYWLEEKKLSETQCRFHHISTDEVFGSLEINFEAFKENNPYQPRSPYSASKAGSDHLVQAYYHTYGLPITMTHCSNNYGPYQHSEKFIPTIIHACIEQKPIPIYGEGKNIRDWLYVKDHCSAIQSVITQGRLGESYNIGGECEWENNKIVEYICSLFDSLQPEYKPHTQLIRYVRDRPGHDFRYAMNIDKIRTELRWTPKETFATGIEKTIKALTVTKDPALI